MAGPVSLSDSYSSKTRSTINSEKSHLSSASPPVRPATILEEEGQASGAGGGANSRRQKLSSETATSTRAIFSPREHRFVEESPLPLTPGGAPNLSAGRPEHVSQAALAALQHSSLPTIVEAVAANLHLPSERKGESLDPKILASTTDRFAGLTAQDRLVTEQEITGSSSLKAEEDDDGVFRQDTLPTAEERNARLEKLSLE